MLQSPGVQAAASIAGDLDWGFVIHEKQADGLDTAYFVSIQALYWTIFVFGGFTNFLPWPVHSISCDIRLCVPPPSW